MSIPRVSLGIDFQYGGVRQATVQIVRSGRAIAFVDFDGEEATRVGVIPAWWDQRHKVIKLTRKYLKHTEK